MAGSKHRVDWTEFEQDTLFRGCKDLWEQPKNKDKTMIDLVRMAQIALPEGRRRKHLHSISNVPKYLKDKLAAEMIGKVRFPERLGVSTPDPKDARLNQIADERDAALNKATELQAAFNSLRSENEQLRRALNSTPSEAQVVKNFIVDILAEVQARGKAVPGIRMEPAPIPPEPKVEPPPVQRRHDAEPTTEGRPRPPKIALVGGRANTHTEVHRALKDLADMRYFEIDKTGVGEQLKSFKEPSYGRVVLWTRLTTHQQQQGLQYHNIPFTKVDVSGTTALIEVLKQIAEEQRKLT